MFAIISLKNKQYRVSNDDIIQTERLNLSVGDYISINKVLLVGDANTTVVGRPLVKNAKVLAQVIEHTKEIKKTTRSPSQTRDRKITLLRVIKV